MDESNREMRIQLEFSCDEDFNSMPIIDGNKFCDKCSRTIHDLSDKSRSQIEDFYLNNAGECTQLPIKELDFSMNRIVRFLAACFLVFGLSLFSIEGLAQDQDTTMTKTYQKYDDFKLVLRGKVTDTIGDPLFYVNVSITDSNNNMLFAITDFEGYYHFEIPKDHEFDTQNFNLSFNSIGFTSSIVQFSENMKHSINEDVQMEPHAMILGGSMIIGLISLPEYRSIDMNDPNKMEINEDVLDEINMGWD